MKLLMRLYVLFFCIIMAHNTCKAQSAIETPPADLDGLWILDSVELNQYAADDSTSVSLNALPADNVVSGAEDCCAQRPPFDFDISQEWAACGTNNYSATLYTVTGMSGMATITFGNKWAVSLPGIETYGSNGLAAFVADLDGNGQPVDLDMDDLENDRGGRNQKLSY
jgi:hypothetical protein